jgi:hypothetical protein
MLATMLSMDLLPTALETSHVHSALQGSTKLARVKQAAYLALQGSTNQTLAKPVAFPAPVGTAALQEPRSAGSSVLLAKSLTLIQTGAGTRHTATACLAALAPTPPRVSSHAPPAAPPTQP